MEKTQAFRAAGTSGIVTIDVEHISGHNVVFWDDIQQVFPGARIVKNGTSAVTFMRDSNGIRFQPHRIKCFPGIVLDVVYDTPADSPVPLHTTLYKTPTLTPSPDVKDNLAPIPVKVFLPGSDIALPPSSSITTSPQEIALTKGETTHASDAVATAIELPDQSRTQLTTGQLTSLLNSQLAQALTAKTGFENVVIRGLGAIHDQAVQTQQIAREVFELQKQMNDRLTMIQNKTEAILTQQFELAEYPIPRLFIVLPEESTTYNPANWFGTKFRLYFICECGEHTMTAGSRTPHHLHLAKHEGYPLRQPLEFFSRYGPYLMLMLQMIKFGTSVAGYVVPPLSSLKVVELNASVQQSVETITAKIDYSLKCIEDQMEKEKEPPVGNLDDMNDRTPVAQQDMVSCLNNIETLEGADLRHLESFLKTGDDKVLGNLYRMVTPDGHLKWVCIDHYRAGYQERHTQKLRNIVSLAGGKFDEQLGKVDIALQSSIAAAEFYDSLCKAKGVVELNLDMRWDCTKRDLEALQDALKKSTISIVYIDVHRFRSSLSSRLSAPSLKHAGLYRLLEPANLKSIHLVLPNDFGKVSNFTPKIPPHLHKLSFDIAVGSSKNKELRVLAEALGNNPAQITLHLRDKPVIETGSLALVRAAETNATVTSLNLFRNSIGDKGLQALSDALKWDSNLVSLNLQSNLIGDKGARALSKALMTNTTLTSLILLANSIGSKGAQALAEALKINSTLTDLNLQSNSIGEKGAQAIAEALKTNSTLTSLNLAANPIGVIGNQALAEALKVKTTLLKLEISPAGEKGRSFMLEQANLIHHLPT